MNKELITFEQLLKKELLPSIEEELTQAYEIIRGNRVLNSIVFVDTERLDVKSNKFLTCKPSQYFDYTGFNPDFIDVETIKETLLNEDMKNYIKNSLKPIKEVNVVEECRIFSELNEDIKNSLKEDTTKYVIQSKDDSGFLCLGADGMFFSHLFNLHERITYTTKEDAERILQIFIDLNSSIPVNGYEHKLEIREGVCEVIPVSSHLL